MDARSRGADVQARGRLGRGLGRHSRPRRKRRHQPAAPVPNYPTEMRQGVKGLRVGFDEAYATSNVIPETVDALRRAINALVGQGAELKSVRMPATREAIAAWTPICLSEALCVHAETAKARSQGYSEFFRQFLEAGRRSAARITRKPTSLEGNSQAILKRCFAILI